MKPAKTGAAKVTVKYKPDAISYPPASTIVTVYSRVPAPVLSLSFAVLSGRVYFDEVVSYELTGLEGQNLSDFMITWNLRGTSSPTIVSGQGTTVLKMKFVKEGDFLVSATVEHKPSTGIYPTASYDHRADAPGSSSPAKPLVNNQFSLLGLGGLDSWRCNDPNVVLIDAGGMMGRQPIFVSRTAGVKYIYASFPILSGDGPLGHEEIKFKVDVQLAPPAFPYVSDLWGYGSVKAGEMNTYVLQNDWGELLQVPAGISVHWEIDVPNGSMGYVSINNTPDDPATAVAMFAQPGIYTLRARFSRFENGSRIYSDWIMKEVQVSPRDSWQ